MYVILVYGCYVMPDNSIDYSESSFVGHAILYNFGLFYEIFCISRCNTNSVIRRIDHKTLWRQAMSRDRQYTGHDP